MMLGHLLGLYIDPKKEWLKIDERHEGTNIALGYAAMMAFIPPVSAFFSSTQIGWKIGVGDPIFFTQQNALFMALGIYVFLLFGVVALAYLTFWMSRTFGSKPNFTQALELSAYTATPIFMIGFAGVYPEIWFVVLVGLLGIGYSVYLLFTGLPIIMHIPKEQGFIYANSIVTCGLVLFITILSTTVILLNLGFESMLIYTQTN